MNAEELAKLTPEQKRVKIGCACGWCIVLPWEVSLEEKLFHYSQSLPDYLNSLDAMHEAEMTLASDEQIERYLEELTNLCGGDTPNGVASFTAYFATAAQRADAFLLTI